jgi:hypothetical protein
VNYSFITLCSVPRLQMVVGYLEYDSVLFRLFKEEIPLIVKLPLWTGRCVVDMPGGPKRLTTPNFTVCSHRKTLLYGYFKQGNKFVCNKVQLDGIYQQLENGVYRVVFSRGTLALVCAFRLSEQARFIVETLKPTYRTIVVAVPCSCN